MSPLPDLAPTATATGFPTIGPVSAPAAQAEAVAKIEKSLAEGEPKARAAALAALDALVATEPPSEELALSLSAAQDLRLVKRSFELWARLGKSSQKLPAMLALMGHKRDYIRYRALGALVFDYRRPALAARVAPYLRLLLGDRSCAVRREAYQYLYQVHQALGLSTVGLVAAALADRCVAVRVRGLEAVPVDTAALTEAQRGLVASLARTSRYPLERCAAIEALARMRHPEAEVLCAKGLAEAAGTTLLVGFMTPGVGSLSVSGGASLAECAARALERLGGVSPKGSALERVYAQRAAMARKQLVALPPKKMCLSEKDCAKDREVCLHLACTPFEEAKEAFWKHRKAERCAASVNRGRIHNDQPDYVILWGFGLDPLGPFRIQMHLAKTEPEAFARRTKAQDAEPCGNAASKEIPSNTRPRAPAPARP